MRIPWAVILAAPLVGGCFYVDPINERPSADIERVSPTLPGRNAPVTVYAQIFDPDGDATTVAWRAYACDDAGCDPDAFDDGSQYQFDFTTPVWLGDEVTPATRVHVELDVTDDYGAQAVPRQSVDINLDNAVPTLVPGEPMGRRWRNAFPVGTPVTITAVATDDDDGAAPLVFEDAQLFVDGAPLEDAELTLLSDTVDAEGRRQGVWRLVADTRALWRVELAVHDPLGKRAMASVPVSVEDDRPPCIGASDPVFPPEGARVVLDEPRRFSVLAVDDDLDLHPAPSPNDPILGAASFRWSLASPATGGAFVPLGVDGNFVELDPELYAPGDPLELRVEAVDRIDRPLCDSSLPSCELLMGCKQRRTWAVEVR